LSIIYRGNLLLSSQEEFQDYFLTYTAYRFLSPFPRIIYYHGFGKHAHIGFCIESLAFERTRLFELQQTLKTHPKECFSVFAAFQTIAFFQNIDGAT
jgi:hypothetical protein